MELKFDNVCKNYGKKRALVDFSATLTEGVYALLGPNGAGKSTLMNMTADILRPTAGTITYNGESIYKLGDKFRAVLGFLPQSAGLYNSFSARSLLRYYGCLKGMDDKKAIEARIDELLELVNLTADASRKAGQYSGGMRQRLGIAVALLNDPKVLILDEPTAGLDPKERIRFRNIISKISFDRIVILATHIVSDVEYIAKDVLLLRQGQLIRDTDVSSLLAEMEGKVWDIKVLAAEVPSFMQKYKISNITKVSETEEEAEATNAENGLTALRVLSDERPSETATPVPASLEDVYLYYFGEVGI